MLEPTNYESEYIFIGSRVYFIRLASCRNLNDIESERVRVKQLTLQVLDFC